MIKNIYRRLLSEKKRLELYYIYYKIRSLFFIGNSFYCNCCNKSFRKFLNKGWKLRKNAQCPYCGSLERNRVLWLYFQDHPEMITPPKNILHIAPEYCIKQNLKKIKGLEYIDADINPNLASHQMDVTRINFPNNYFDLIICSHVMGHIPNEEAAFKEFYRVLSPLGKCIFMTLIAPNNDNTIEDLSVIDPQTRLRTYGEPDLCRLHGKDFASRIIKVGFKVEVIDYRLKVSENIRKKYSLGDGEREQIFLSTK